MTVVLYVLIVLAVVLYFPQLITLPLEKIWPSIWWRAHLAQRLVSLSFDDGPDPIYTPRILQILRKERIRATFFLAGDRARIYPNLVSDICRDGHEIANHSDSWARTVGLDDERFSKDLRQAEATLKQRPCFVPLFRPAGVMIRKRQRQMLRALNYECVLGCAYGFDPYRPPAGWIAWEIGRGLRPGAIIVLHDSGGDRSRSVEATSRIIAAARARQLDFVKVSELIDLHRRGNERH